MRIAVSGSAGVGKTTLAGRLAGHLQLAFIPEHYEPFFDAPGKFNSPPPVLARWFFEVLEAKRARELAAGAFVVDRCPTDLFNLWVAKGLAAQTEDTQRFYAACRSYCADYDLVVIPPWGEIPLAPLDRPTGRQHRVLNPWVQLRNHAAILGLARLWLPPEQVVELPAALSSVQARVEFVADRARLINPLF